MYSTRLQDQLYANVSRDSEVAVVTRERNGHNGVQIPVEAEGFSLLQNFQTCSEARAASYSATTWAL